MEKFIVGIDADGVLTDMSKFNIEEGKKFFKKEPINPDAYSPEEMFGISKFQKILFGLKVLDKYCKETPLRDGAFEVISKLKEEDVVIHSITARMFTTNTNVLGKHYRKLYEKYLKKNGLVFDSIQYCSESYSPRDKYMACSKLDVDLMIEDKPEVAYYLAEQGIKVLLFNAPYNKNVKHENIIPVSNWKEVYDRYKEIRADKKKVNEFVYIEKSERESLSVEEQVEYLTSYKSYLKNIKVNVDALKRSERRFKLVYWATLLPFSIFFSSKVKGKENIPYQNGFIIASNHLDSFDQFYISRALGNRQFCGFAASTIKHTIRGRLFKFTGGAVFIDRADNTSKKEGEEELATKIVNDKIALIFPEGTRKNKDEEGKKKLQLKFKLGTVSLAQKTGAAILPVSLYHGKHTYLKIGELQFVKKSDNLIDANERLANTIMTMITDSIYEDRIKQKKK